MDFTKSDCYEFLDLTGVEDNEKAALKNIFCNPQQDCFLQLPWMNDHINNHQNNHIVSASNSHSLHNNVAVSSAVHYTDPNNYSQQWIQQQNLSQQYGGIQIPHNGGVLLTNNPSAAQYPFYPVIYQPAQTYEDGYYYNGEEFTMIETSSPIPGGEHQDHLSSAGDSQSGFSTNGAGGSSSSGIMSPHSGSSIHVPHQPPAPTHLTAPPQAQPQIYPIVYAALPPAPSHHPVVTANGGSASGFSQPPHAQNVFVSNLTANVNLGYPAYQPVYVPPPQATAATETELRSNNTVNGRNNAGIRDRSRVSRHRPQQQQQVQSNDIESTSPNGVGNVPLPPQAGVASAAPVVTANPILPSPQIVSLQHFHQQQCYTQAPVQSPVYLPQIFTCSGYPTSHGTIVYPAGMQVTAAGEGYPTYHPSAAPPNDATQQSVNNTAVHPIQEVQQQHVTPQNMVATVIVNSGNQSQMQPQTVTPIPSLQSQSVTKQHKSSTKHQSQPQTQQAIVTTVVENTHVAVITSAAELNQSSNQQQNRHTDLEQPLADKVKPKKVSAKVINENKRNLIPAAAQNTTVIMNNENVIDVKKVVTAPLAIKNSLPLTPKPTIQLNENSTSLSEKLKLENNIKSSEISSDVIKNEELTQSTNETPKATPTNSTITGLSTKSKTETSVATNGSQKSWASLFSSKSNNSVQQQSPPINIALNKPAAKPLARVSPFETQPSKNTGNKDKKGSSIINNNNNINNNKNVKHMAGNAFFEDPNSYRLGEFLSKYVIDNRTVSLLPRGLTNRSNFCYVNSILQALLACPPFYNLMQSLPQKITNHNNYKHNIGKEKSTSIIDSIVTLVNEFSPLPPGARVGRRDKTTVANQKGEALDIVACGPVLEPTSVYQALNLIRSDSFSVDGRQEDAEEFLGCLLNSLNDEMVELIKLVEDNTPEIHVNGKKNISPDEISDEDEWKVMGPKNKGSITRRAEFSRSPVSDIFRGQLRSRVQRAGDQSTDNVQPFFTLQLDIEKAASVKEALDLLVGRDRLEGVTCSRTQQAVEAWQQVSLEELPLVLILHLKCFHYERDTCSKIIKNVEFPVDLKIDAKLMSANKKYANKQKQYKLFAVVYHDGKEATKGHYITDAFHVGYGGWVRYDDSSVRGVSEVQVLKPRAPRMPYLLYYRRCDTIGNNNNNNTNNNINQQNHQPQSKKE